MVNIMIPHLSIVFELYCIGLRWVIVVLSHHVHNYYIIVTV
jgi:hypothetical protein